jgi:hypothetical protein
VCKHQSVSENGRELLENLENETADYVSPYLNKRAHYGGLPFPLHARKAGAVVCKEDALAGLRGETLFMTSGDVYRVGVSPMPWRYGCRRRGSRFASGLA